jgi:pilus assembly protein CpaC
MRFKTMLARSLTVTVATALVATMPGLASAQSQTQRRVAKVAQLPAGTERPTREVLLSVGQGELINLPTNVANVWTSNPAVADVYVSNPRQIHLFGKEFGEATVFATTASGAVVYSSNVRVSQNITSIDSMLKLAMPESDIRVTTAGQMAVLTGVVASPDDAAQAKMLVTSLLNPGVNLNDPGAQLKIVVISRLRTATPLQVNLQVKIAEVSRQFAKDIGNNLITRGDGGFKFGVSGRDFGSIGNVDTSALPQLDASARFGLPAGSISLPFDPRIGDFVYPNSGTLFDFSNLRTSTARSSLGFAGRVLGLDIADALDLGERDGSVTTLASPNLTALSGETASFLAGGEIPIPISQGLGAVTVEYKQYGVSLAFTPTVLADGRISMRVRPEVSQLSAAGSVTIGGTQVPGLTTRRAETTLEMGSGQSMMIGGLLSNSVDNSIDKTPGLGDVPVLGSLFRSNAFRRAETELVIVITPYLVKPVNAGDIKLPTDGFKAPTDAERVLLGQTHSGTSGEQRPIPTTAPSSGPVIGSTQLPAGPSLPAPAQQAKALPANGPKTAAASATPGFSF